MENNRTYGIEFEVISQITRNKLANKIMAAFAENNIDHTVSIEGYGHSTDGTNFTNWILKTDSSINTFRTHPHGIELVSPVLKGEAGLKAVKIAAEVLDTYCTVNRSCGLHVHHGVTRTEMINTCKAWAKAEITVLDCLPPSRRSNPYSRRWGLSNFTNSAYERIRDNRYVTLNLQSYALRSTLEFRCAAGTTSSRKAVNWILFTQGFVVAAQNSTPSSLNTIEKIRDFVGASAAQDVAEFNSRSYNLQKTYTMLKADCFSREEIINYLVSHGAKISTAKTIVSDAKNARYTPFGRVAIEEDGIMKFAAQQTNSDVHYINASAWLVTRYNHFQHAA